jgi:hypothetical protein
VKRVDIEQKRANGINPDVIVCIGISVVLFGIANSITPQVDSELDFFELTYVLGQAAASGLAFIVAKRYWGSTVFGRAYLSLGIAYALYCAGTVLWLVFQIYYGVNNPYPYWPDIGYFLFYPFAIYHLATNVHFFKKRLERSDNYLLALLPTIAILLYASLLLLENPVSDNVAQVYDQQFLNGTLMGTAYVGATTVMFSYSLMAFRMFRKGLLGAPWGLLFIGLSLNWLGDFSYYYSSIYSYDRTNPIIAIWMTSYMIVCYALYKHRVL